MKKVDYKKDYKALYLPKNTPSIIDIPVIKFARIHGTGNPNEAAFAEATAALYSLSYAVKMSYKSQLVPENYYEYTVFPLEGVWDLVDKSKPSTDKNNYAYDLMIRQPDFLTPELFERFIEELKKKKPNDRFDDVTFITETEGLCCQMLHLGSYDDEPESFRLIEQFCDDNGFERISKTHREIYLSDPRKTELDRLKTVLRIKVRKKLNETSENGGI